MPGYYPIFLNIEGQKCVVVGGGAVAERKVRTLLEHGATVKVVSPRATAGIRRLAEAGSVELKVRAYRKGDLKGARLAIAATDDAAINEKVAEEARALGVPVNVVDDPGLSEFIVPSVLRRGDVVIAVSTGGRSPALARKIRTDLEQRIGPGYATLARLVSEIRDSLKAQGARIDPEAWQDGLEVEALIDLIDNGKVDEARRRVLAGLLGNLGQSRDQEQEFRCSS